MLDYRQKDSSQSGYENRPNNRKLGAKWEQAAGEYLASKGLRILQYNFRCRLGEIDIVALDGNILVFAEVKYRKNNNKGTALEAVGLQKQIKISKVAAYYLICHKEFSDCNIRFDVIGIDDDRINWIPAAFEYMA